MSKRHRENVQQRQHPAPERLSSWRFEEELKKKEGTKKHKHKHMIFFMIFFFFLPAFSLMMPLGPMGAQASRRSRVHWQLRMRKEPVLSPVQLFSLNTSSSKPCKTRLYFSYFSSGTSNNISVNMASLSIHQIHSTCGCPSISFRMSGSLAQNPAICASKWAML